MSPGVNLRWRTLVYHSWATTKAARFTVCQNRLGPNLCYLAGADHTGKEQGEANTQILLRTNIRVRILRKSSNCLCSHKNILSSLSLFYSFQCQMIVLQLPYDVIPFHLQVLIFFTPHQQLFIYLCVLLRSNHPPTLAENATLSWTNFSHPRAKLGSGRSSSVSGSSRCLWQVVSQC